MIPAFRNPIVFVVACCAAVCVATLPVQAASPVPCFDASAWPEADRLFRTSGYWLGADGAYSVDLGEGRSLWLFGDTWIDATGRGRRAEARMVRSSVAIQEGADPSKASIAFFWRTGADGGPADFWPRDDGEWDWPGHGIRLADRLVVFLVRQRAVQGGLGFEATGWDAVLIDNPDDAPPQWRMRRLEPPPGPANIVVSGGVMREGPHVYALASSEPASGLPVFLLRWPADALAQGDLSSLRWWGGRGHGWTGDPSIPPAALFEGGQTELSIHRDAATGHFIILQSVGFGPADVAMRYATALGGPWSRLLVVYRPPEVERERAMIYAAKAQPHLAGADLVATYATNSFRFADHFADAELYYPRFVRGVRCPAPRREDAGGAPASEVKPPGWHPPAG